MQTEIWMWMTLIWGLTLALSFGAGIWYARLSVQWTIQRAQRDLSRLFQLAIRNLDTAHETCQMLLKFPGSPLTSQQRDILQQRGNRLTETVTRIFEELQSSAVSATPKQLRKTEAEPQAISWQHEPVDPVTELPARTAFDSNLLSLLELGRQADVEHGLLLVKLDRFQQLESRFGTEGAHHFLRRLSRVVCRAMRDDDLLCRFSTDTLAVLMPGLDREQGARLAEAIRNTVRHHHFRLDESGPEVLVTASFGFGACLPEDNVDLAMNRAGDALAESQRRGRNQLHVHDGSRLAHCVLTS